MTVRLGDVCTIVSGTTPKSSCPEYWDGDINWVTPAELNDESNVIYESQRKITKQAVIDSSLKSFPAGTVFLSSRAPIGKVAIAGTEMYCNQGFKNLICSDAIYNRYLYHFLKSKTEYLNSLGRGATFKEISKSIVEEIEIPLPSLEEQRRIADRLDKLSGLIAKRRAQLEKLEDLVKSRFVELFDNGNYPMVKAEDVCEFITKGTTPPTGEIYAEFDDNRVPYLKVYNLSFDGSLLFDSEPQYISKEIHNGKLSRSKVYPNDVLMNIVGPPLGKFSVVTDEYPEWNINQAISIFRAKQDVLPRFLLSALMQPTVLEPFLKQAVGVRQLNISLEQCRNLQFPLPPIERQKEFVIFAEQTDKSKLTIQQSLDKLEVLKKALMQQYFGQV